MKELDVTFPCFSIITDHCNLPATETDGKDGSSLVVLTSESELTAYRLQFGYKGPAIRFGNFDQLAMFLGHEATTGTTHVVFDPWDEKRILISTSNFLAAYGSGSRDED